VNKIPADPEAGICAPGGASTTSPLLLSILALVAVTVINMKLY